MMLCAATAIAFFGLTTSLICVQVVVGGVGRRPGCCCCCRNCCCCCKVSPGEVEYLHSHVPAPSGAPASLSVKVSPAPGA
eukprot:4266011-Prymnesium_polylepis.3